MAGQSKPQGRRDRPDSPFPHPSRLVEGGDQSAPGKRRTRPRRTHPASRRSDVPMPSSPRGSRRGFVRRRRPPLASPQPSLADELAPGRRDPRCRDSDPPAPARPGRVSILVGSGEVPRRGDPGRARGEVRRRMVRARWCRRMGRAGRLRRGNAQAAQRRSAAQAGLPPPRRRLIGGLRSAATTPRAGPVRDERRPAAASARLREQRFRLHRLGHTETR